MSTGPPRGFNFNAGSSDPPVADDPRLEDFNVQERVNDFVLAAHSLSNVTRTVSIFGCVDVYVYVCVYVSVYIYIYIYICLCVCVSTCTCGWVT